MLTEALGQVFVCGGLAVWLGLSFLIASMVMALVATNLLFPEYNQVVLSVVVSTTVFFELIGPPLTRLALRRGDRT